MCRSIHETATVGQDVTIGDCVVIEGQAKVGDGTVIGNHVTVCEGATIGASCRISDSAIVGKRPALAKSSTAKKTELAGLVVGDGCAIGSHTVIMAGTTIGSDSIVGDGAGVRERVDIGDRVVVGRNVTVENDTTIGSGTRIQTGAYITAYVTIEEDCFIAPMVVTTNDNYMGRTERRFAEMAGATIRKGARVGGGAHLLPGVEIGEEAFVATGAVVTRDVAPRTVVMGVPAKPVRRVADEELLENS